MINDITDFLRATEAAAIAASEWVGTGDKLNADKAATDAMRERLNRIEFAGKVVIGEGKKDESAGLFNNDWVGRFANQKMSDYYELAVDPIDGTRPTVTSGPEALSVLAAANAGCMFTTEEFYMHKLAYGPLIAHKVKLNIHDSIETIVEKVSKATGKAPHRIVVCLLDRPRHEKYVAVLRKMSVRTKLIQDCDISGAIATCLPESGIDLLYGIGGAPEAVITAAAMKCLGGGFQAQIVNKECAIFQPKVYDIEDLVKGECAFAATGITNGSLLKGVRFTSRGPVTHSVMMRSKSGTVRWITAYHGN
ncbi:MAG: fructose-bisphosphatase class II family protein [Candidatus Omnitrophica bacterium]|nr:fructose-bisphosphatase class II family protein [Candidatus Omnitrophota bacterium]